MKHWYWVVLGLLVSLMVIGLVANGENLCKDDSARYSKACGFKQYE